MDEPAYYPVLKRNSCLVGFNPFASICIMLHLFESVKVEQLHLFVISPISLVDQSSQVKVEHKILDTTTEKANPPKARTWIPAAHVAARWSWTRS